MGLGIWLSVTLLVSGPSAGAAQHPTNHRNSTSALQGLPLTPARSARFRVTEGTWMSLDVAADGRTILFDLLGDLYTIPIHGGRARRLTTGMAVNRQPRYSPDGRRIVFVSDRSGRENVWIADHDGRDARQISDLRGYDGIGAITSPVWSPDGQSVFVSQRLGATRTGLGVDDVRRFMWLVAAYDMNTRRMRWVSDTAPTRARSALGPAFDPVHRELYAAMCLDALHWSSNIFGCWRIGRLDQPTGRLFPEMSFKVGRVGVRPAVSPNGRFLVYASSSGSHLGFRVRDLSTDEERWLVREVLDDPSGQEEYEPREPVPGYAFTPDSKFLVAAYGGKIHRIDLVSGRSVDIPFITDVERPLGPMDVAQFSLPDTATQLQGVLQADLSPDGSRVAFSALNRIWVMNLPRAGEPASQPIRLTNDSVGEFYPAWSPDGQWIAYTTWQDGDGGAIWRSEAPISGTRAASQPQRLTSDTALYLQPAVAPDGERIVAVRLDAPPDLLLLLPDVAYPPRIVEPRLVSVPSRGGASRTVAFLPSAQAGTSPHDFVKKVYFTADPGRIYLGLSSWGWQGERYSPALAFKDQDGVMYSEQEPPFLDGVLSPNGRRAMVSVGSVLYEAALPDAAVRARSGPDTLELIPDERRPFGGSAMAVSRWGTALSPWVSWSWDGRRAAFAQGGVLYVGTVQSVGWTDFQRVEVPLKIRPDAPKGTIAFRGARILTMREGPPSGSDVIERGDLVVRNNRIVAVGPSGRVAIPPDAHVIASDSMTILPGYVDIHEHNGRPHDIHAEESWKSLLEMAYGITAVRDPYSKGDNDDFAYADRERAGDFLGPRMFSTGVPYLGLYQPLRTLEDAREAVERHAKDFRTETFKLYGAEDRRARQLVAMATRDARLNATIHNNGGDQALATVIDGLSGIEHSPSIRIYDDLAALIAQSGVTLTHTYLAAVFGSMAYMTRRFGVPLSYQKVRRFVPPSARESTCLGCTGEFSRDYAPLELNNLLPIVSSAARIVKYGGLVAIGSHGNLAGIGFHYEMWLHALGGMSNYQILRSATIVGAGAIGHARDFGSLEPGKLADLQVLDKNPLRDIHNSMSIRYVMKNGRLYDANDLTEMWPRHKRLAPIYLWDKRSELAPASNYK